MLTFMFAPHNSIIIQSNKGPYYHYEYNFNADVTKEMWVEFFRQYRTRGKYLLKSSLNQSPNVIVFIVLTETSMDLITQTIKGETRQKYEYDASLDQFMQNLEQHFLVRTQEIIF